MDDDTTRPPETTKRRQRRGFGASLALVGLLAAIGLLAAACGGGSKVPGAASGSGSDHYRAPPAGRPSRRPARRAARQPRQSQQLQFAQCMRSHGVTNFPDPSASGGTLNAISAAGINTQSPTVQAALQACKQYTPAGT